ncbi:unnamed protein product [Mycena citricolor]|uniref:NACHT domain-containing protein n=1 Tax=Mycena citricolor TaxID=2018698 RepID=A0AAD2HAP2_9AGAR|nr:unnamed protein product [Mycena citricolor]
MERTGSDETKHQTRAPVDSSKTLDPGARLPLPRKNSPFKLWSKASRLAAISRPLKDVVDKLAADPGRAHTVPIQGELGINLRVELCGASEVLQRSREAVLRRKRILDRLGKSQAAFEHLAQLALPFCELNPITKAITGALGVIYTNLKDLQDWDANLVQLIDDMTQALAYVQDLRAMESTAHLKQTLIEFDHSVQDCAALSLIADQAKTGWKDALTGAHVTAMQALCRRFERWRVQFHVSLQVDIRSTLNDITEQQKKFFERERWKILDMIRPLEGADECLVSGCMAGTRERVLTRVDAWARRTDEKNILWITGHPGSGKSCVARSVADRLDADYSGSAACFFFSRGTSCNPITATRALCADLAQSQPAFADILSAQFTDSRSSTINFRLAKAPETWSRLIHTPLGRYAENTVDDGQRTLVLVIDALDESDGVANTPSATPATGFLDALATWATLSTSLRLIVTSRTQHPIPEALEAISERLDLSATTADETWRDIYHFLTASLQRIRAEFLLPRSWPREADIDRLVDLAGGLWVWAHTVVQLLWTVEAESVLRRILSVGIAKGGQIWELYRTVLLIAFPRQQEDGDWGPAFLEDYARLVGALACFPGRVARRGSPLLRILRVNRPTRKWIVQQLRPVLKDHAQYLAFEHRTFVEFLTRSERCPEELRIDSAVAARMIACAMLDELRASLRFDETCFKSSRRENSPRSTDISEELKFASL